MPRSYAPWVVWLAVLYHAVAGFTVLVSSHAGQSTAPDGIVRLFGSNEVAGVLMIGASAVGLIFLVGRRYNLILLFPQQILLAFAAANAVASVLSGHYADGVGRPYEFILADQLPIILLAVFHMGTILDLLQKQSDEALAEELSAADQPVSEGD